MDGEHLTKTRYWREMKPEKGSLGLVTTKVSGEGREAL